MLVVWTVFLVVAGGLTALSAVGLRWHGTQAPVFHLVGAHLLLLSIGTAVYPSLLSLLGPGLWAAGYVAFVAMLTVIMTLSAVVRARRLRSQRELGLEA